MSKSEIEKIKAVLSDMNNCDETRLWMQNSKGEEYEAKIITRQEFRSLTKALEIAVEALEDIEGRYEHPNDLHNINSARLRGCQLAAKNTLKQISEILEAK